GAATTGGLTTGSGVGVALCCAATITAAIITPRPARREPTTASRMSGEVNRNADPSEPGAGAETDRRGEAEGGESVTEKGVLPPGQRTVRPAGTGREDRRAACQCGQATVVAGMASKLPGEVANSGKTPPMLPAERFRCQHLRLSSADF